MSISTQHCKDFISSIASVIQSDISDKWKRTKKYKQGELVLRDFVNQDGRTLTIAENQGKLFLYQLSANLVLPSVNSPGSKFIGHKTTEKDIFTFMAECVTADKDILGNGFSMDEDNLQVIEDGKKSTSWTVWETWTKKDGTLAEFLEDGEDYDYGQFDLYYADENGQVIQVNRNDILQAFWVGMSDYDTAYRIYVFETKNHTLLLGCNNPD